MATRRSRSDDDRTAGRSANADHLLRHLAGAGTVCAFLPLASEPLDRAVLDRLTERGVQVLVPIVTDGEPLDWVRYPCPTVPGSWGIAEPTGERLGSAAVLGADAVVIPAFAVDRRGVRMGRGGGHYDRTLALLNAAAGSVAAVPEVIAVLFDGERPDELPAEPHDRPVTSVVSPSGGWQPVS